MSHRIQASIVLTNSGSPATPACPPRTCPPCRLETYADMGKPVKQPDHKRSSPMSTIILIIVSVAIYFLPTILAFNRENHTAAIFALNLFLGWTLVGWVVALVLALWQNNANTNGAPVA